MSSKRLICIFLTILLLFSSVMIVSADSPSYAPYYSYEINKDNESVAAPVGFLTKEIWNSETLGLDIPLSAPRDFVVGKDGFYILDSGNSRIIKLDFEMKLNRIFDTFFDETGQAISFANARGFDIDRNDNFVIADTDNNRIMIIGRDGRLIKQILRPDAVLQNEEAPFQVSKVKCSDEGNIYVTVESMNLGIFVFDEQGRFDKFVANNPVVKTADVILNYFYRAFLSTEQIRNRTQSTPLKVTNFCIDKEGFLYTVSQNNNSTLQTNMVRCMNYTDTNIIVSDVVFGDVEYDTVTNTKTLFTSIAIDDDGNIILLDKGRGKVFYYSDNGYLISVFGGLGDQIGTFREPTEVRAYKENIYVLDTGKNCIVEFAPTDYITTFRSAISLLEERRFDESLKKWEKVNTLNSNSQYAYYGMGLVYDLKGDFKKAMDCFRLSDNQTAYSNSFEEFRMVWMSENIVIIVLSIVLLIILIATVVILFKHFAKVKNGVYSPLETKWLLPLYTLRHPIDGFEQFKRRDIASIPLSIAVIILWFLSELLSKYATGFIFSGDNADFNPLAIIAKTLGLYVLFVAANWCVASFLEGKGTLKDIVAMTSYSLIPYVIAKLMVIPLSNILTQNEAVFISLIGTIGILWTAFLLIGGLYAIHQYSFSKTLLCCILTLIGMIIIIFVLVIFYSLLQQAFGFIESLYQEITL